MLTKRARTTLTPYALLAAKVRNWVPPHGLTLKSYAVKSGFLGITFEVILSCQCEAEEALSLQYTISYDQWEYIAIHRDVMLEVMLDRMYEEAKWKMAEHTGARA